MSAIDVFVGCFVVAWIVDGFRYVKAGILFTEIIPAGVEQMMLFDPEQDAAPSATATARGLTQLFTQSMCTAQRSYSPNAC